MNSPYLIIDRSGNAVDINSTEPPTCHDHYRTCHGCPDRVAEPRCHMTCEGYKARQAEDAKKREAKRIENITFIPDSVYVSRSDIVRKMEKKGYRR